MVNSAFQFLAIATVFLGVAQLIFAVCPYVPTLPTTATYCMDSAPAAADKCDTCNSNGTFKSISYCYPPSNAARGKIPRYDFYTCTKTSSGSYVMAKGCCTNRRQTPCMNGNGNTDVVNYYNAATGKCDVPDQADGLSCPT